MNYFENLGFNDKEDDDLDEVGEVRMSGARVEG